MSLHPVTILSAIGYSSTLRANKIDPDEREYLIAVSKENLCSTDTHHIQIASERKHARRSLTFDASRASASAPECLNHQAECRNVPFQGELAHTLPGVELDQNPVTCNATQKQQNFL